MDEQRVKASYTGYYNLGWQTSRKKAYDILEKEYPEAAQFLLTKLSDFPIKGQ